MLREFLEEHGFSVVCLNGSMDLDQRRRVQQSFAEKSRILVSTDSGGEGLNLQFAHVVINYDLPWNPMRIEQRIGRVDRIGQKLSGESIQPRLRGQRGAAGPGGPGKKLATILDEFGVDKTEDVLDSAESGASSRGCTLRRSSTLVRSRRTSTGSSRRSENRPNKKLRVGHTTVKRCWTRHWLSS